MCEPVRFLSEYRYYVCEGAILGRARYDQDGPDDAPAPDSVEVERALECLRISHGERVTCGLDVGVLEGGETALVEVNDGWALGYYARSITSAQYLWLLQARWLQLLAAPRA